MSSRSSTYLGADVLGYFDRVFDGRELTILGYKRQRIDGNWKLMQENIKDPYHPGLLHTWFVTFGLWRADQKSQLLTDAHGRSTISGRFMRTAKCSGVLVVLVAAHAVG